MLAPRSAVNHVYTIEIRYQDRHWDLIVIEFWLFDNFVGVKCL